LKPTNSLGEEILFAHRLGALLKPHLYEPELVAGALERLGRSRGSLSIASTSENVSNVSTTTAIVKDSTTASTSTVVEIAVSEKKIKSKEVLVVEAQVEMISSQSTPITNGNIDNEIALETNSNSTTESQSQSFSPTTATNEEEREIASDEVESEKNDSENVVEEELIPI
jgi:hypothetical protein